MNLPGSQTALPLEPPRYEFGLEAARALPKRLRLGASSWTYAGWRGLIYYESYRSERDFNVRSLGEYARHPLFRTVGIDSFYYAPPSRSKLESYAELLPADFQWVSKVWERLTVPRYPRHPRYGAQAGQSNPEFLNSQLFLEKVLEPYATPQLRAHTGPFVFQFSPIHRDVLAAEQFLTRLDRFLGALPRDFRYAVEIRNAEYLGTRYFGILNQHGVAHCFNHWNTMPRLKAQMLAAAAAGGLKAEFFVSRILTPHHISYEEAVKQFAPYDSIKVESPTMRQDVVRLARRAVERDCDAYVLVNNRAEGNSPMTIDALARAITSGLGLAGAPTAIS